MSTLGSMSINEILYKCKKKNENGMGQLNCSSCPINLGSMKYDLCCSAILDILEANKDKYIKEEDTNESNAF